MADISLNKETMDILKFYSWDTAGGVEREGGKYRARFVQNMPERLRGYVDEDIRFCAECDINDPVASIFLDGYIFDGTDLDFADSISAKAETMREYGPWNYGNDLVWGMSDLKPLKLAEDIKEMLADMETVAEKIREKCN